MEYNFSKLWADQFMRFYEFKDFYEYASDEERQREYYKGLGVTYISEEKIMRNCEMSEEMLKVCLMNNRNALNVIKNYIIVFLFTRYKFVIQETLECLICDNPLRIMEILKKTPEYEETLRFSLVEFLRYDSKKDYVRMMSERLSSRIVNGKPSKVIKRIKCLIDILASDLDILDDLMEKRNQIVHDGKVFILTMGNLENYYNTVETLLKNIALELKNMGIDVVDKGSIISME